jgi:sugar lactone lactonase YvrE
MNRSVVLSILLATCVPASIGAAQALQTVVAFNPAAGELPESVTLDHDGNLYMSMGSSIVRRTPDGVLSTFGTLPIAAFALGVKVGPDGCVYTASTSLDPSVDGAFVWRICSPGTVEMFAELDHTGAANDLAFDDDGNLFVTDPFLGQVWKVSPEGDAAVWVQDPLLEGNPAAPVLVFHPFGADGIAFDKTKHNLYVGNVDAGHIVRIPVQCDGSAGALSVFVSDSLLAGVDGIAFDNKGTLYATVNAADRLVSIDADGDITVIAEGGLLDSPSSVAFGTQGNDKKTLYVTSSAVLRAFGIKPGVPHPALLKTSVKHKGLALP